MPLVPLNLQSKFASKSSNLKARSKKQSGVNLPPHLSAD
ncbi:hypothetical protein CSUNSWCD_1232 [Campylobacter showae CSUNSWCD]|uniref:Uncharacterized protein n=1 Tax=Campylobacter showae CSUNSWCD TaxID=1244083 RepID=M5ISL7_9BACT|nr:hypothetical protein CSUNSWCD_1232 [Campylobacter showae CSUNSWCD]